MDFSQSVFVKGNIPMRFQGTSKISKEECDNFAALDKKTDLFCEKEVRLKYSVNKIIIDMESLVSKVNLKLSRPPFLQNTISLWRRNSYEKLEMLIEFNTFESQQQWRRLFYDKVDLVITPQFIEQLPKEYYNHIFNENYQIPPQLEPEVLKKSMSLYLEMHELSEVISKWSVQLEIACDLIERVNLYEFSDYKQQQQPSIQMDTLQKQFDINQIKLNEQYQYSNFKEFFIKKALTFSVKKLSTLFSGKGLSWGTALSAMYSVALGTANPIAAVIIGGVGNTVMGKIFSQLSSYLEKDDKRKLINQLIQELIPIIEKLKSQLLKCEANIQRCFNSNSTEELNLVKIDLKQSLDQLFQSNFDEFLFMQDDILKEERIGDWNVIDYAQELQQTEIEDEYELVDF